MTIFKNYPRYILFLSLTCLSLILSTFSYAISANQLVKDARSQIGQTLTYDPAYTRLSYPMGDVPIQKGVCTDVVIRALRKQNIDLQKVIHEDMKRNFNAYPKLWGLKNTDRNIDHRRVPNIAKYMTRQGYSVQKSPFKTALFKAGDIVTWDLGRGLVHIGIVSDRKSSTQVPLIIHNIGRGTQEENILLQYKITGHYRIP
ncbi:DUF1287 domain-containing protein [Acinetobacter sp. A3.8]|uniref:DUF1287 domain-containing protein n=1 Tax=Acinetobacter sedimenti TaxID=2919922 RepID=A0A9X1WXE9_9GAMM|nr:DUF1287 domain-containing protein [Acinetobacter sedimenti]MCJ8146761.1 DUF1287 domain-containing protein [Acinetobacter sedimenti]